MNEIYEKQLLNHDEGYFKPVLDFLYKNIDKSAQILDIGAGIGSLINILKSRGYTNVYGIELNKKYVDFGRNHFKLNNVLFTFDDFPGREKSFDVVLSFTVAEHVDDINNFIDLKLTYLKNQGIIYTFAPDYQSIELYKDILRKKLKGERQHLTPFNKGGILRSIWMVMKMSFWVKIKQFYKKPRMIKVTPLPLEVSVGGDADATWCCNYEDIKKCFTMRKDLITEQIFSDCALIVKVIYKKPAHLNAL